MGKNIYKGRELMLRSVSGGVHLGPCVAIAPLDGYTGRLTKAEVCEVIAVLAKWLANEEADAPADP